MTDLEAVVFLVGAVAVACMGPPEPKATETLAPDGKPALLVTCHYDASECFQVIGERCKRGYDVLSKVEQHNSSALIVRCR